MSLIQNYCDLLRITHVGDTNMITFILKSYVRWRN